MKPSSLLRFGLLAALMLALLPESVAEADVSARESMRNEPLQESPLRPSASGTGSLLPEHARAIREIGAYLSPACRRRVNNLYVRYDKPGQRGLGGKSTVIISGRLPLPEFRAVLAHELLGHLMDLGCITGNPRSGASAFKDGHETVYADDPSVAFYGLSWKSEKERREEARNEDFVSGYARADAFEDLAETAVFYVLHRREFERMAQKNPVLAAKLAWMKTVAFPDKPDESFTGYRWNAEQIPWDSTKLPYVWVGSKSLVAR